MAHETLDKIEAAFNDTRTVALRQPFLEMVDGDLEAAAWFSQTVWKYAQKVKRGYEDAWVDWTADEADEMLGLSEYTYARVRDKWDDMGLIDQEPVPGKGTRVRIDERALAEKLESEGYVEPDQPKNSDRQSKNPGSLGGSKNTRDRAPSRPRSGSRCSPSLGCSDAPDTATSTHASGGSAAGSPDGSPDVSPSATRGAESDDEPEHVRIVRESKSDVPQATERRFPHLVELRRRIAREWPVSGIVDMNDLPTDPEHLALLETLVDPSVECGFKDLDEAEKFLRYLAFEASPDERSRFAIEGVDERLVAFHVARHAWLRYEYGDADEMEPAEGIELSVEAARRRGRAWELGKRDAIREKSEVGECDPSGMDDEKMAFNVTSC